MPYINISGGLTLTIPTAGTNNYADNIKTNAWQKIADHDHTGGGKGTQIGAGALAANAVGESSFRLANNSYLRARNAANSADVNLIKIDNTDKVAFGVNLAAFTVANNTYFSGRNAANTADVSIVKVNASDRIEFGATVSALTLNTALSPANGGTGATGVPANGQIPIGNGTNYTVAGVTGTANRVTVTNGAGTITLSTPQDTHAGASPSFTGLTVTGGAFNLSGVTASVIAAGDLVLQAATDWYAKWGGSLRIVGSGNDFSPVVAAGVNLGSASNYYNGLQVERIGFQGTHGNSTKNPASDAPDEWAQVVFGITTYYIPLYAA